MSNGCCDPFRGGDIVFSIYTSTKAYVERLARASTAFNVTREGSEEEDKPGNSRKIRSYAISPSMYRSGMNDPKDGADAVGDIVNLILKDFSGDPSDVAKVVLSMFDGTTRWAVGDNVCCEGPYTYSTRERYGMMYDPVCFGVASPPIPLQCLRNAHGEPVSVTPADIQRVHDKYKASGEERKP